MRALRKLRPELGARLVEVPVPEPGPGEVLLKVAAASICGTDQHIYLWNEWAAKRMRTPVTFGHEVAGHVVATGPEVHHIGEGSFVSAEGHVFCGFCPQCRKGRMHICENLRILGVDFDGGFADYVAIPVRDAWEVDPRIAPDVASIEGAFCKRARSLLKDNRAHEGAGSPLVV